MTVRTPAQLVTNLANYKTLLKADVSTSGSLPTTGAVTVILRGYLV